MNLNLLPLRYFQDVAPSNPNIIIMSMSSTELSYIGSYRIQALIQVEAMKYSKPLVTIPAQIWDRTQSPAVQLFFVLGAFVELEEIGSSPQWWCWCYLQDSRNAEKRDTDGGSPDRFTVLRRGPIFF